jgi:hypothetical protein
MANQDDGFLREIEEELRRERLEKLWRQYGTYFLAGAALIVLGVLLYQYIEGRRIAAAEARGAQYQDALTLANDKKEGSAEAEFKKIAEEEGSGYAELARLQLAGALLKDGKKPEALAAYEALANQSGADELLRSFAALQAAALRLGEADFTEMQNRLTPLMGDNAPWRYNARELLGLAAFKAGNSNEARALLTPLLVDQKAPETIAERAKIVMAEIAAGEIAKKGTEAKPAGAVAAEPPAGTAPATKKE